MEVKDVEVKFMTLHKENRFVALFAAALVLATSIPYLAGHFLPFQSSRFNGNLLDDGDFNTYFAFMRQAAEGQWLFHNPFTPEPHEPVFFNLEWLVVGKLAAVKGISLEGAFQLERIVSIFVLCFAFNWLSSFLFNTVLMRRLLLTMVMVGGGFGWLLALLGFPPRLPHLFVLDMHGGFHPFFWILFWPHPMVAQIFAILALCFFLRAESSGFRKGYFFAALCCAFSACIRPYDAVYLSAAIALYTLILTVTRQTDRSLSRNALRAVVLMAPAPMMIHYLFVLKIHPVFQCWGAQSIAPPPRPDNLAATLGISTIVLILGLGNFRDFKKKTSPQILMVCCLVSSLILLYCYPIMWFSLQFSSTLLIPVILAGTMKLEGSLISMVRNSKWASLGVAAVLFVNSLTSLWLLGHHTKEIVRGRQRTDANLLAAYSWLDEHSEPGEIVLPSTSYPPGNQIPRYTHNTVFSAYQYTTVDFQKKDEMIWRFFLKETPDAFRYDLLREFRIRYIFLRSLDRIHITYNPDKSPFLKEIFRNNQATIYEFVP